MKIDFTQIPFEIYFLIGIMILVLFFGTWATVTSFTTNNNCKEINAIYYFDLDKSMNLEKDSPPDTMVCCYKVLNNETNFYEQKCGAIPKKLIRR